ncbi:D-Ala-D-Ala carboxypeptidase family metallohydrolase [Anabaena sp. UHCC 0451]|uniref:D-Ala-D-Ala carboxypeptidase family metallohydrolase n=1 Tax=Anabaena sp. UHCC 0451 TaxID=2055235 RepID=UPI002B1F3202|nr:D-Ala-D-Ala carboxypeptidase family metallohydrolase [Anabaena sp. UHCC 0451]MEA5577940.1 D-Ala-D-Ala carboxypeptidase family metallohydrolase [Anabaena sp. UHCC 0451]
MTSNSPDSINPGTVKSLSEFVKLNPPAIFITDANPDLVKEIQQLLKIEVDGVVGPLTKQAFSEFKQDNKLAYPLGLGVTTAKELLELKGNEEIAGDKEEGINSEIKLNPSAGSRTGASMKLPGGEIVYANQYIVEGIPLTWGEATKNCTRIPTSSEYVANAIRMAKTWGPVREKFASPIKITSGYRPPAVNKAVGGAPNSQHLYFRAIDMIPMNGDFKKLWDVLKASQFSGLGDAVFMGKNKGFFHADIRPGGRVIFPY